MKYINSKKINLLDWNFRDGRDTYSLNDQLAYKLNNILAYLFLSHSYQFVFLQILVNIFCFSSWLDCHIIVVLHMVVASNHDDTCLLMGLCKHLTCIHWTNILQAIYIDVFTCSNDMCTWHVQLLRLPTITCSLIQPDSEFSHSTSLSIHFFLNLKLTSLAVKLLSEVSVGLSFFFGDELGCNKCVNLSKAIIVSA